MKLQEVGEKQSPFNPWLTVGVAWFVTLLATAAYLALIDQFDWTWILFGLFLAASLSIVCYWLPGEPKWMPDEIDLTTDSLAE